MQNTYTHMHMRARSHQPCTLSHIHTHCLSLTHTHTHTHTHSLSLSLSLLNILSHTSLGVARLSHMHARTCMYTHRGQGPRNQFTANSCWLMVSSSNPVYVHCTYFLTTVILCSSTLVFFISPGYRTNFWSIYKTGRIVFSRGRASLVQKRRRKECCSLLLLLMVSG